MKKRKQIVFGKLKVKSTLGFKMTKFNELIIIPKMRIKEKLFYKCITQY